MGGGRSDRIWLIGGALGAVVLLAVGWFFFISPQNHQTSDLRDHAAASQLSLTALQRRLGELRQQDTDLPKYRAQLARDREALPAVSDMANFLRELQAAADVGKVSVGGIAIGVAGLASGTVSAVPITVTATGTAVTLNQFLDQIQRVLPRAVLVSSANVVANAARGAATTATLTLVLQAFVAPTIDVGTSLPTTVN